MTEEEKIKFTKQLWAILNAVEKEYGPAALLQILSDCGTVTIEKLIYTETGATERKIVWDADTLPELIWKYL